MSLKKSSLLIVLILVIDQVSKVYVKTHFALNDGFVVFDWFKILFVENDGMAWGTKISDLIPIITDQSAKLFLTLFRIVAVFGIGIWLVNSIKNGKTRLLVIAISLILAGALGNIIDSVFYGIIFNDSHGQIATFLPEGGGYSSLFHGKVVDMLYFPIWKGAFPYWMPFVGGEMFTFFNPVFNIADMAISTGIGMLIFFNKAAFRES
ncbi:lipoprotein signal peptidase [Aegicerativicinus sediminis]